MIQSLIYKTKDGTKITFKNFSIVMGIHYLLMACSKEDLEVVLKDVNDQMSRDAE